MPNKRARQARRRPRGVPRPLRDPSGLVPYRFTRSVVPGLLTAPATDSGWSWSFALSDVPNSTEFTALFDQYCFTRVTLEWSLFQGTTVATQAGLPFYNLYMGPDYDTLNQPTSLSAMLQRPYKHFVLSQATPRAKLTVVPRVPSSVTVGASAVNALVNRPNTWLDCAQPTIAHNGIVGWIGGFNTATQPVSSNILLTEVYELMFRVVR